MSGLRALLANAWAGPAASVVLAVLYPTVFVLSQNWYALHSSQIVWLLVVAVLAGIAVYTLLEILLRAAATLLGDRASPAADRLARAIVFAAATAGLVFLLLQPTVKTALPSTALRYAALIVAAAILALVFARGGHRYVNNFLGLLVVVASASWAASMFDTSPDEIGKQRQDFEAARFTNKPNIYLFIYDAYASADAYRKVYDLDNAAQYRELEQRGFKVLHTFANYNSTLQTAMAVFLGSHHYYRAETGLADTQKGRPLLAGVIHNPGLETLRANGYRLQYIHGIDYFVNEQGILDYMFPEKPISSALRVFGVPLLKMKRNISEADHEAALDANMHKSARETGEPWFTFAHVNKPGHANLSADWRQLGSFAARHRDKTIEANRHMLATIDRIRTKDPDAVIILFGDHGGHRYVGLGESADPNATFQAAGVPTEHVTLDRFGIMIAVGSAGACDAYFTDGTTPVNILRSLFACLVGDMKLLDRRAADVALYRTRKGGLFATARDGRALPEWKPFDPE